MTEQKTVTIKGVVYDMLTGQPVPPAHPIKKFAPAASAPPKHRMISDIAPVRHPAVAKAHAVQAAKHQPRVVKPAQLIKQQAISDAMERANSHSRKQHSVKPPVTRFRRTMHLATMSLAALVLGGYLTYLNMPALSTRVAAAQSGIDATYPSYTPTGYGLHGPVAYGNGMVSMKFSANAGPLAYTIQQERSSWDSSAVRENYITPKTGKDYTETQAHGLTIYTYGQNAAWVNGGIFYTITGNAPLSSEQVQHIAVSM